MSVPRRRATVPAVGRRLAAVVAPTLAGLALLAAACDDDDPSSTIAPAATAVSAGTAGADFDCIAALAATGFTASIPAGDAVAALQDLVDGADSSAEAAYFQAMLDEAGALDADEPIGTALDDVPCDL
jgi:hypothetical protein